MDSPLGLVERWDVTKIPVRKSLAAFLCRTREAVQSTYWDSHADLVDVLDLAASGRRSIVGTT